MSLSKSAPVELDFFGMERESSLTPTPPNSTLRLSTFNDIQREVSKLNPEVIKSVFASASTSAFGEGSGNSNYDQTVCAPMTIFYNGTVSVFDVPHHRAESILQIAQQGFTKVCIDPRPSSNPPADLLQHLTKGLPVSRRRSLRYFLEKRRERITMKSSPYGCPFPNQHHAHNSPTGSSISLSLSLNQDQVQNPMTM